MRKVAIITGGARGIGAEITLSLAEKGYAVAIIYNTSEINANKMVKELNKDTFKAVAVKCDVRDYGEVVRAVAYVKSIFGRVDVLVNNAGIAKYGLLMDTPVAEWRDVMRVNLDSAFYFCKEVIPLMLEDGGSIVNISSVWGLYGSSMEVAYSTSKAGLIGFTKALSQELGAMNIRVNAVAAGVIETDMNKVHSEETISDLVQSTSLCRLGSSKDVANAVVFLASENAAFITGEVIEVSGGFKG